MWGTTVIWSSPPATPTDPTENSGENALMALLIATWGALGWLIAFP